MKISDETRQELYNAIHDEIMKVRIALKVFPNGEQDNLLRLASWEIWAKQKCILEIKD